MKFEIWTHYKTGIKQEIDARNPDEAIRMAIANLDSGCLCEMADKELIKNAKRLHTEIISKPDGQATMFIANYYYKGSYQCWQEYFPSRELAEGFLKEIKKEIENEYITER